MPLEQAAAAAPGEQQTGAPQTTGESTSATTVPEVSGSDILREAGIPEEVVSAFEGDGEGDRGQKSEVRDQRSEVGKPGEETSEGSQEEPEVEPSTLEQSAGEEEREEEEEPGQEEAEEPTGEEKPSWYQKRLAKWTRQKDRLQDEIDDLKEQIAGRKGQEEPSTLTSKELGRPDVFARIETMEELNSFVQSQRQVRDWCLENPDGLVVNEGKENEQVIAPQDVRKTLIGALRILEDAPRIAQGIQTRQQWTGIAQQEWPELYDRKSEVYQTSQAFLKSNPAINSSPDRDFLLGLMVEGWKTFKPRLEARIQRSEVRGQRSEGTNGTNGAGAEKTSLPEALKRKIPPIPKTPAPNPPRGSRGRSPQDQAAAAVERLAQDGSPEAAMAAIAAIDRQNAVSGDTKRMPAPV